MFTYVQRFVELLRREERVMKSHLNCEYGDGLSWVVSRKASEVSCRCFNLWHFYSTPATTLGMKAKQSQLQLLHSKLFLLLNNALDTIKSAQTRESDWGRVGRQNSEAPTLDICGWRIDWRFGNASGWREEGRELSHAINWIERWLGN